jgi:hypothetical protein
MRTVATVFIVSFIVLVAASGSSSAQPPLVCPAEIKVDQRAGELPAGWKTFVIPSPHRWVNVIFSDGDPSKQAELAPTRKRTEKGASIETWVFEPSPAGIWLSCSYTGTSLVAAQKLPDNIKSCDVEYDKRFATPVATKVTCK